MSRQSESASPPAAAVTPVSINHIVLNVRDIEESHRFWTEIVGLKQVGEIHVDPDGPAYRKDLKMRFYSADHDGKLNHHDLALVEQRHLPAPPEGGYKPFDSPLAINHIAITLPDRESWLRQLAYVQSRGIKFGRRVNHGMTHSLYITDPNGYGVELLYELPRSVWEGDIDAALNYVEDLPTEGAEAFEDKTDVPVFGAAGGD
ncbi:MAG: VOC family protein [Gammaproteobacteria bacterium]|nr:VOC family protein [Gammaproteobacteria bacterium]